MLRRRGLEECDFTEEVMQPPRPQRVSCQLCERDITTNNSRHRILCTGPDNHVFCKDCVINYVNSWVRLESSCELRQNKAGPSIGVYALPCLATNCQQGCFTEPHMQPILPNQLFVEVRQKISFVGSRRNRGRSPQTVNSSPGSASSQPPPRHPSQDDQQQRSQSLAPTPPSVHLPA